MPVPPTGSTSAKIMLVGEAPSYRDMQQRQPFSDSSGQELNRMLHEVGITRNECFLTLVAREEPPGGKAENWFDRRKTKPDPKWEPRFGVWVHPQVAWGYDRLLQEIELLKPNVIVAFGNLSLMALTGKFGIKSWRGSMLETGSPSRKVIPVYAPEYIMRDWSQRQITVQDLRRVKAASESPDIVRPDYNFIIRPSFNTVMESLNELKVKIEAGPTTISVDIETRAGHIACIGYATDKRNAICIPLMCTERDEGYWSLDEEVAIVAALKDCFTHRNSNVLGQNFIYDSQYILRHWGFVPRFSRDTMLGHHTCFAGMPKGLDFLSSMYCEHHLYWKDEGKTWDAKTGEDQLWAYNCKDCVITFEANEGIERIRDRLGLAAPDTFQQQMFWPVLQAMVRGVRVDLVRRADFSQTLSTEIATREAWFTNVLGHPLNPQSPKQMKELFYEDLRQPLILSRKGKSKGNPTLDDEALQKIAKREPMLRGLVRRISEHRSLNVFRSTFVEARLDQDQRIRCSYNIAGTGTFRLSSSENAFDSGLNLQNIPKGGEANDEVEPLELPNVRTLFVPDEGYTFWDADLDRADLAVVIAEADDAPMREAMARGVDMHLFSARDIFNLSIPDDEIVESHPKCAEHKRRYHRQRQKTKAGVHAVDYYCQDRTLAVTLGISVHEAGKFISSWFSAHPGIKAWHTRTIASLQATRTVHNKWGYRRIFYDRLDAIVPEALAWIPQSTVGITINKIWYEIYSKLPAVQVLLQVHDSLAGQFPTAESDACITGIRELARSVIIPYDIPLNIPLGIKTSTTSWGDCT